MTRNKISALAVFAIVLVVFNIIAFAVPFVREIVFWLGYGFTLFALLLGAAVIFYAFGRAGLKSKYYGMSLAKVAGAYLLVQLVVGFACMALPLIFWWIALVANVLVLAAAAVGMIAVDAGSTVIAEIDQKVVTKTFYIRSLQQEVEGYALQAGDTNLQKQLSELAEAICYSDPMSHEQLATLENNLVAKTVQLGSAVASADTQVAGALINELKLLLLDRNRKCKLLKGM